jgi:hypothetical protein
MRGHLHNTTLADALCRPKLLHEQIINLSCASAQKSAFSAPEDAQKSIVSSKIE